MLRHAGHPNVPTIPLFPIFSNPNTSLYVTLTISSPFKASTIRTPQKGRTLPHARRMVRYDEEDEDEDEEEDEDEDNGHNAEIARIESYSKLAQDEASTIRTPQKGRTLPHARRMVRYNEEDEDEDEDYGHNAEIAMIESYSEMAQDEVLLVRAMVDDQEEEVIVFKGFSSALSYRTSPDPSRSVLPARAVIKSIDRIKGPFDPSNIEYLEKGLTWKAFKSRFQTSKP